MADLVISEAELSRALGESSRAGYIIGQTEMKSRALEKCRQCIDNIYHDSAGDCANEIAGLEIKGDFNVGQSNSEY